MKLKLLSILLFCTSIVNAKVIIPKFFSDNMVLQRNVLIPIWGWANPNERIQVNIHNQTKNTITDAKGNWLVTLDGQNYVKPKP